MSFRNGGTCKIRSAQNFYLKSFKCMSGAAIPFHSRAPSYKLIPHLLPCQLQSGLHTLSGLHHFPSTPCQARPSLTFCLPRQVLQVLILLPSQAFIIFPLFRVRLAQVRTLLPS
ncbi:hypothetical protein ATANTOWER_032551 [Ataeniobius toweri]|uniref:Uncharacterized protein n=1 Tax=Ataeniobius toweri TaxID=208326 RepID=A0ABU7BWE4_9TELE|nr:hypothetical protein [Ataeniobius toweri]